VGESADVIAVVKAGDKLYSARKAVKVTVGGCG
jgi:sulfur-oxidizing protein SoxY